MAGKKILQIINSQPYYDDKKFLILADETVVRSLSLSRSTDRYNLIKFNYNKMNFTQYDTSRIEGTHKIFLCLTRILTRDLIGAERERYS